MLKAVLEILATTPQKLKTGDFHPFAARNAAPARFRQVVGAEKCWRIWLTWKNLACGRGWQR